MDPQRNKKKSIAPQITKDDLALPHGSYNLPFITENLDSREKNSIPANKDQKIHHQAQPEKLIRIEEQPTADLPQQMSPKNKQELKQTLFGPDPKAITELLALSNLLQNAIDQSQLVSVFNSLNKASFRGPAQLPSNWCKSCFHIELFFYPTCSHPFCMNCIKTRIFNFASNPCVKTYKALRCHICFEIPKTPDVLALISDNSIQEKFFNSLEIRKKCFWCNRSLNIASEFLPELYCLHLCRECFTDQVFIGITTCLVCSQPFKNLEKTKTRTCRCVICNVFGDLVHQSFKSFSNDRTLCYSCQMTIPINEELKKDAFGELDDNEGFRLLRFIANKMCPVCGNSKALADIVICKGCQVFKCNECCGIDSRCERCLVEMH